ncbi:sigma-70 family RNA polymerase sigma factor [Mesorhizobium sp. IMUNJ 23232]|uniref:sigma-70 family RNA polymerase sigma factor n=1 Tax=Mesorhizobium sp. IMUNJ 23232 TaxID=3376064 RepID=UPI00379963AA
MTHPPHPACHDRLLVDTIPALRAFARTFDPRADRADDLVQETLLKGLAAIDQFNPGTSMRSWLFTIMRNAFYTGCKREKRECTSVEDDVGRRLTVEASQEWTLSGGEVQRAMERLPASQREVVCLVAILGVSYIEAAEICGCEIGTIKSKLSRARNRLVEDLGERSASAVVQRRGPYPASIAQPALA